MKVEGPGKMQGAGPVRRTGKTDSAAGAAFAKALGGGEDTAVGAASGVHGASAVNSVSGVLAAQEVDDAAERESRGKKRALDLLEKLDDIRHGMLGGDLPKEKLLELSRLVQSRRIPVDNPNLAQVLDEIDLRAQVELAKFQR